MRYRAKPSLFVFVLMLANALGCQSLYRQRPIVVQIRDAETKQPLPVATVQITTMGTKSLHPLAEAGDKTDSAGIVRLTTTPNGQHPHQIEAAVTGYMTGYLSVNDDAIEKIEPVGWFENVKEVAPQFTLELYSEPKFGVELLLPPAFRGVIKVDLKIKDDQTFPAGQRIFQYKVDQDGVVHVVGPGIVLRRVSMANYVAKTEDGIVLTGAAEALQVGLRWFKQDRQFQYFFIGTQDEYDRFRRNLPEEDRVFTNQSSGKSRPSGGGGGGGGRGGRGGGGRGGSGSSGGGGSMPGIIQTD